MSAPMKTFVQLKNSQRNLRRIYSVRFFCNKSPVQHERRIFSGIQPTGIPHIGNYLGAIKPWLQLQESESDVILSIVDLHSITLPQDPNILRENILSMTACLLACGIDPEKNTLFVQSMVGAHTELAWILGCLCTLPQLKQLPQWKEKSAQNKDPGLGLFTYPVLQAADILLYKATEVPVGEDQRQHIELARHLARAFNRKYGTVFPSPQSLIGNVPKIHSLRNPTCKMSKSDPDRRSRIELTDSPDEIRATIRKAVTDMTSAVTYDPEMRPGVSNLIDIHCAFTDLTPDVVCDKNSHLDTGQYKSVLADVLIEKLSPIRDRIIRLEKDKMYLLTILEKGRDKAKSVADRNLTEIKQRVGFL